MLTDFIIFGGVLFWVLVAIVYLAVLVAEQTESPGWATTLLAVFVLANVMFGDFGLAMKSDPMRAVIGFAVYFAIGIAWTVPAWVLFLRKVRKSYVGIKYAFARSKNFQVSSLQSGEGIPTEHRSAFRMELMSVEPRQSGLDYDKETDTLELPTFGGNVERFYLWAIAWPASVLNSFIGDLLHFILESLRGLYDKIAIKIFQG